MLRQALPALAEKAGLCRDLGQQRGYAVGRKLLEVGGPSNLQHCRLDVLRMEQILQRAEPIRGRDHGDPLLRIATLQGRTQSGCLSRFGPRSPINGQGWESLSSAVMPQRIQER